MRVDQLCFLAQGTQDFPTSRWSARGLPTAAHLYCGSIPMAASCTGISDAFFSVRNWNANVLPGTPSFVGAQKAMTLTSHTLSSFLVSSGTPPCFTQVSICTLSAACNAAKSHTTRMLTLCYPHKTCLYRICPCQKAWGWGVIKNFSIHRTKHHQILPN
jgi:hypothetical protein